MRLSRLAAEGRIFVPTLREQVVRRTHRLRGVRFDGRQQPSSCPEVSQWLVECHATEHPSFWFLFPVANYATIAADEARAEAAEETLLPDCFGCAKPFPNVSTLCPPVCCLR